ncbi:MAG: methyltransferase domain-containing protein [Actinomycetales bacterium]|nr:methyltransferase domain-containing protein [Actinomycetales bacterium]
MPANDPAGRRFGEAVEAYERGRPDYPRAVVEWLLADRPEVVVDVGAGTGKLTRAVAARATSVVAVEPDPQMRAYLSRSLPGIRALAGTGESLPLADSSADAVVSGQAWHWVDPDRAVPEVARVLRPDGTLGLVWNDRDEDDPWIARLSALLDEYGTSPDADYEPVVGAPFSPIGTTEHRWVNEVSDDSVVDMIVSRSYVIALPDATRHELLGRLRELAADGRDPATGLVPVRYVTRGYRYRLVGAN